MYSKYFILAAFATIFLKGIVDCCNRKSNPAYCDANTYTQTLGAPCDFGCFACTKETNLECTPSKVNIGTARCLCKISMSLSRIGETCNVNCDCHSGKCNTATKKCEDCKGTLADESECKSNCDCISGHCGVGICSAPKL